MSLPLSLSKLSWLATRTHASNSKNYLRLWNEQGYHTTIIFKDTADILSKIKWVHKFSNRNSPSTLRRIRKLALYMTQLACLLVLTPEPKSREYIWKFWKFCWFNYIKHECWLNSYKKYLESRASTTLFQKSIWL